MRCRWVFPLGASTLPLLPTGHRYGRTSVLGTEPRGASAWAAGFLRVHPLGSRHTAYPTLAFRTAISETEQTTARVPFRARCPRAAAGGWARAANKGGAERGARGRGWRASLRQEAAAAAAAPRPSLHSSEAPGARGATSPPAPPPSLPEQSNS